MNEEEFVFAIRKANPNAVFEASSVRCPDCSGACSAHQRVLTCTPTVMTLHDIAGHSIEKQVVVAYRSGGTHPIVALHAYAKSCSAPRKRRLMTAAECAGKWMVEADGTRHMVFRFNPNCRSIQAASISGYVSGFHKDAWKVADTPTSEPYSLEIDE